MATITYSWNQDFDFLNKVINTTTAGDQSAPAVAALANVAGGTGGVWNVDFIATWDDPGNGGDSLGRLLTAKGTQPDSFGDFGSDLGFQSTSSVAGYAEGGYVRVFVDATADPGGDIHFAIRQPGSSKNDVVTNSASADFDPDVAVLADGGFVVSWTRGSSDVIRKVFNNFGTVRAEEAAVDGGTNGSQPQSSSVAALAGGGFVVVFHEIFLVTVDFHQRVLFRRYDANGIALDAVPVIIDETGLANRDIQVLGLRDGGFVVAYTDTEYGAGTDIHARIYNEDGSERIDLGRVNSFTPGEQDKPALTLLSNGYFAVGWQNQGLLKVQAFDPDGNAIGVQTDQGSMLDADIAGLADGRLVSVRSSSGSDGSGTSIRASASDLVRTTTGNSSSESLSGDNLIDIMFGNQGQDTISGGGANDTLNGGAGGDTVRGGAGDDTLNGDAGNDILLGGPGADTLNGGDGTDTLSYAGSNPGVTVDLAIGTASGGHATGDTIAGFENIIGSNKADTLTGDTLANVLDGGKGNDTINGGGGGDRITGGAGNDVLNGDGGADIFLFAGGFGVDSVNGGTGPDTLDFSLISGATGVVANLATGVATFGANSVSFASIEKLVGSQAGDTLNGNNAANTLDGGAGADTLNGAGGNDRLIGGNGVDTINGGAGLDTFVLMPTTADRDLIQNFIAADDTLEVSAALFGGGLVAGALNPTQFVSNTTGLAGDADDRFIYNASTGELFFDSNGNGGGGSQLIATLTGTLPALSASDFAIV